METTWAFYYWVYMILYKTHVVAGPLAFISFIVGMTGYILFKGYVIIFPDDEVSKGFNTMSKLFSKMFIYVTIPMMIISIVVPNKNDAKIMLALVGVETAVKNERVQNVAYKSVRILEKYIDKLDRELK